MGVGSFPCNVVQALARCAEPCSLGRAAPGGAEGAPGGHGSTSLCGQLSPDLLGQQESSIRITELMIKENSNHQRETSAAGGSRCLSRELSGCFGAEGVLRPGKKGPRGSSCDIFRTVILGLHRPTTWDAGLSSPSGSLHSAVRASSSPSHSGLLSAPWKPMN